MTTLDPVENSGTNHTTHYTPELDDVSSRVQSQIAKRGLDHSGMGSIAVPLKLDIDGIGFQTQFAEARASVNTISGAIKGIHMSRLYLNLSELSLIHI